MSQNIELLVLIKGRPIPQYHHQGKVFIEGRAGSEYEIELRNHTSGRVEVVLSVDGLSVIDGKSAGPQSSGYLLTAHQVTRIPGWILNDQKVAKFAFADKEQSYSTQMSEGEAHNNGVIGVMAFAEKYHYVPPYNPLYYVQSYQPVYQNHQMKTNYDSVNVGTVTSDGYFGSALPVNSAPFMGMSLNTTSSNSSHIGASASSGGEIHQRRIPAKSFAPREEYTSGGIVDQSLGTAFGESANFATTKVSFERAEMISMMTIFYDNSKGLKDKGIIVTRPKKRQTSTPNPFPGMSTGCVPPEGWYG